MRRFIFITTIISLCFGQQTYDSEIQPIWDANCTSCHGNSGNLDLSQGVSYSNIVNVASSGYSGFLLVKPNDPMNSVIHQKIVGNSAFGERMPKNAPTLSASDESKIKTWIEKGAPEDWSGSGTQSYSFDFGPGGSIDVKSPIENKQNWSIETWVKFHSQPGSSGQWLFFLNNNANNNLFTAYVVPNEKKIRINVNNINISEASIDDVFDQNFHHFYIESDGSKLRLIVDGIEKNAVDFSGSFPSSDKAMNIGLQLDGSMDEIRFRDISGFTGVPTQRYNSENNTVLLYQFDNQETSTINDNSGLNNNGTVIGQANYEGDVYTSGGGGTLNTIEIVARLNQNIGNGDVHVGVWLPGNSGNPDITDNKDNRSSPSPVDGWGFQLSDSRITPSTGPYKVEVFFDQNNNDMPDANEPYATFNLNTDNQGYAFQDIEMFSGGGGTGDNLYVNLSVNDVLDGINGQMFIEVVRMEQAGQTIIKTFQFGEVTPIQNKHMDLFVEGMNNGENAFIYARFDDENGEVLAEGESPSFNWPPNNDIDVILEPAQYSGSFKANITVTGTEDSGSLSFRIFPEGTIITNELPDLLGAFYGYDQDDIYSSPPNNEEVKIEDFLMGIPFGKYPIIIWYDVELNQSFNPEYDPIVAGMLNINNIQTASFVGGPLSILPGPVIQGGGLQNLTPNEGDDLTVSVNVSKGLSSLAGEVDMVELFYSTGDGIFGNIFCNNLSGNPSGVYECVIPGNDITNRGLVLGVDAWDMYGALSSMGLYDVSVQFDSMLVSSFPLEQYVMVSVPAQLNNASTQGLFVEQLGDPDPSVWRTFKWENGAYQENGGNLNPGSAVWLISKDIGEVYARSGYSTQLMIGYYIPLTEGWNQIGSPYNFPIDINDDFIVQISENVEKQLYQYSGGENYSQTSVMEPGSGYWIFSSGGSGYIKINTIDNFVVQNQMGAETLVKQNLGWQAILEVTAANQKDLMTSFGVHPNAKATYDQYDFHEPPVIGEYVSAYFKHSEVGNLNQDIRSEGETFYSWSLTIKTNQSGISELYIPNINEIPFEHSVKLFDPVTRIAYDMRQQSTVQFVSQGKENPHYFELMVGKDKSINNKLEKLGVVPNKFELAQNIPNPFNPVTNILISLKEDANITLKVFNLLGEEINSMAMNQPMSKGNHRFIWAGKAENGQPLPSGIYLYRLEVQSNNGSSVYQNTKKMILMK